MKCMCTLILVIACVIQNVRCQTSSAIPTIIQNCYRRNFTITARPPITLPLLVELLRKIEIDERNSITARLLATSMLHGVIFNGIRKSGSAQDANNSNVIPYRASGREFYRYLLLVDYLIPGQIELFPADSLSQSELCFLHSIVSRTVDPSERGDEISSCNDRSSMPIEVYDNVAMSNCPLQKGIIKTKWGPISPSIVISALAAGMENNEVTFDRLSEIIVKGKRRERRSITNQNFDVNVVWVATLAGDLAATILNQTTGNPIIGNRGFWNDTLFPRAFYLKAPTWDMTQADILAGIDGAILGTHVSDWLRTLDTMRLSQILDMYYSERGVPFGLGHKAGKRSEALDDLWKNNNLEEQIIGSVKLLQGIGGSGATFSDFGIQEFAREATAKLKTYAGKIANEYDKIEYLGGKQMMAPIELIIILDGTFDYYKALQMIYTISEAIQVSHYGSKIGVIHGQTGNWIVNVTRELFQIFADLNKPTDEWPILLNLQNCMRTVGQYYDSKTYADCTSRKVKPVGRAILVLSQNSRLTDNDLTSSQRIISTIKSAYPGTRFFYLTQATGNSTLHQLVSKDDQILTVSTDVLSFSTKVVDELSQIPANIVKYYCNETEVIFEDYITPEIDSFYIIPTEFIKKVYFDTAFINKNYGDISVCAFKRNEMTNRVCKDVTLNREVNFSSKDFCTPDTPCDLLFQVTGNNSQIRCAEYDCRYPDQIRIDIRYTYSASGSILPRYILLVILVKLLLMY